MTRVVSRDEWLAGRLELLAEEKAVMRAADAVTARRQALGMVRVEQDYRFDGPAGEVGLAELFEGRRQLIVYHFMFHPDWEEGCPSCSYAVDNVGRLDHLHYSDTTFALVSRAPLAKLEAWRTRMGWSVPWYSSAGSTFNYDFHATNDESVAPVEYNYKDKATMAVENLGYAIAGDAQGLSVFVRGEGEDDGQVFHAYSTYGRGAEVLLSTYHYLDLTPRGRRTYVNEFPYHDTYGRDTYGTVAATAGHHHH